MGGCSVPNCGSRTERNAENISFHRYPVQDILQQRWKRALNMPDTWVPYESARICSKHFDNKYLRMVGTKQLLTKDACPKLMFPRVPTERDLEMDLEENGLRKRKHKYQETPKERKLKKLVKNLQKKVLSLRCDNNNLKDLARSRRKKVSNLNKRCDRLKNKVVSLKRVIHEIRDNKVIILKI